MSGVLQMLLVLTAMLGAIAVYLLLPRIGTRRYALSGVACAVGALLLLWVIWMMNFQDTGIGLGFMFCLLGSVTIVGAVMTITQSNPVSCALWFALVVIGTAGLFMLVNAQFLAAAIVVVYAGAIIVMFLFVVMMAQQHGTAIYDRVAREPLFAVIAGFLLLIAVVSATVATYRGPSPVLYPVAGGADVSDAAALDAAAEPSQVASLGRALLIDHWLSLEVAGAVLLVSMVGAILISSRSVQRRAASSDALQSESNVVWREQGRSHGSRD